MEITRDRSRILAVLLADGGEERAWLIPWSSWMTCTLSTAFTARVVTRAPRPRRSCGWCAGRPARPSARCTPSAASRSWRTAATRSASLAGTGQGSPRCFARSPGCCPPSGAPYTPPVRPRCLASTPRSWTTSPATATWCLAASQWACHGRSRRTATRESWTFPGLASSSICRCARTQPAWVHGSGLPSPPPRATTCCSSTRRSPPVTPSSGSRATSGSWSCARSRARCFSSRTT